MIRYYSRYPSHETLGPFHPAAGARQHGERRTRAVRRHRVHPALPSASSPTSIRRSSRYRRRCPGANPQVVESAVTDILEEELSTVRGAAHPHQLQRRSSSATSPSSSPWTATVEDAAQDVRDKVSRVRGRLPDDVEEPVVAKQEADAQPFFWLALSGENYDLLQLSDIADRVVKTRLQTRPRRGPGASSSASGATRCGSGCTPPSSPPAASRCRTSRPRSGAGTSRFRPAGSSRTAASSPCARWASSRRPRSSRDLVVSQRRDGADDQARGSRPGRARPGGRAQRAPLSRAARRSASASSGSPRPNLVEVADAIHAALPAIQAALPPGVRLIAGVRPVDLRQALDPGGQETLLIAAVLVVIIIFVFLRNLRATIIPALAIPTSHRRDLRGDVLPRLLDQQPHPARAHARDRHRGGRRDHRAGERLPAPGGAGRRSRRRRRSTAPGRSPSP